MSYVFPDKNIHKILIDISGILLDNCNDRMKAYTDIISKYPFN